MIYIYIYIYIKFLFVIKCHRMILSKRHFLKNPLYFRLLKNLLKTGFHKMQNTRAGNLRTESSKKVNKSGLK